MGIGDIIAQLEELAIEFIGGVAVDAVHVLGEQVEAGGAGDDVRMLLTTVGSRVVGNAPHISNTTDGSIAGRHFEGVSVVAIGDSNVVVVGILYFNVKDIPPRNAAVVCKRDIGVAGVVGVRTDGDALS